MVECVSALSCSKTILNKLLQILYFVIIDLLEINKCHMFLLTYYMPRTYKCVEHTNVVFSDRWWFAVQMSSVWTCLQATRQSDKTPALRVSNFWTTVPLYYLSLQGQAESASQDPHGYSTWGVHLKQTIKNLTCSFDTRSMDFFIS